MRMHLIVVAAVGAICGGLICLYPSSPAAWATVFGAAAAVGKLGWDALGRP